MTYVWEDTQGDEAGDQPGDMLICKPPGFGSCQEVQDSLLLNTSGCPSWSRRRYFRPCTAATISLVSGTVGMSYCFTKRTTPSLSMTTTARAVMPRSCR
jgi:hypothetical protein